MPSGKSRQTEGGISNAEISFFIHSMLKIYTHNHNPAAMPIRVIEYLPGTTYVTLRLLEHELPYHRSGLYYRICRIAGSRPPLADRVSQADNRMSS